MLEEAGIDAFEISGGVKFNSTRRRIKAPEDEAYFLNWVKKGVVGKFTPEFQYMPADYDGDGLLGWDICFSAKSFYRNSFNNAP